MKITFIGAGNLATNLALELYEKGFEIIQVYSRTEKSAKKLAAKTNSQFITDLNQVSAQADLYIISVKDDLIEKISAQINWHNKLLVHTAGSIPISVLEGNTKNYGVFYPLQTFSKEKKIDFSNIPICLEANSDKNLTILQGIAHQISFDVRNISSEQRKTIHLAAVFACNFTNHLFAIAEKILIEKNVNFDILNPLIKETLGKALKDSPALAQTGPAIREDKLVMNHHFAMLKENDNFAQIYEILSKSIQSI